MRHHRSRLPLGRVTAAAALLALAVPSVAHAHGPASTAGGTGDERDLRGTEQRTLGPRHAAEHAAQRAGLRRWAARPATERARLTTRARRAATRATAAAGPADQVGRWSAARTALPTWAINAVVLPTGKVAYWGRGALEKDWSRKNSAPFYVWDPATGRSEQFDPPSASIDHDGDGLVDEHLHPAPIFCSGQSLLPSGELFVAGGNAFYPYYGEQAGQGHADYGGWAGTYSFDPWTEKWTTQPRMNHGRWYPTQVLLPDGRIGIASGYDEVGNGADNREFEVFTPAARRGERGTMRAAVPAERVTAGFYPHMQVLPGGRIAYAGPFRGDTRSLDPADLTPRAGVAPTPGSAWRDGPRTASNGRVGGSAALLPGTSRMLFLGGYGWDWDDAEPGRMFVPAARSVETTDFAAATPTWERAPDVPDMNEGRSYGSLVGLPDGGFAYVGGAAGFDETRDGPGNNATNGRQQLKAVELWHPGESRWRVGPAQAKWRSYHSTALLLPDGRVLSAGDDYWGMDDTPHQGAETPQDEGEIYEPAYLFDGSARAPRPRITSGPSAVRWGAPFGVGVDEVPGRRIVRATLIAPGAATHGVDMNRAFAELRVERRVPGAGVDLRAPSGADVAPPGWYMLFAWDETGTPSVARWVRIAADAPAAPPVGGGAPPTPPGPGDPGGPGGPGGPPPDAPDPPPGGPAPDPPFVGEGPPAPGPSVRDTAGPRVAFSLRRPARRARTLRLRVGADEPARIVVRWRVAGAREGTATVRLTAAQLRGDVRIPLARGAQRTLRAGRALRVVLRSTARDAAGHGARRTVVVRLRPRAR